MLLDSSRGQQGSWRSPGTPGLVVQVQGLSANVGVGSPVPVLEGELLGLLLPPPLRVPLHVTIISILSN